MRVSKLFFLILIILHIQNHAFSEVINLPKTGQKTCYDSTGNIISCNNTGQDGDWQAGVSWPSPRFIVKGDGTITDNLTGLMWLNNANCLATEYPSFDNEDIPYDGKVTWQKALDFVAGINTGTFSKCSAGYNDWRLPNVNELESLVHLGFKEESCGSMNCYTIGEWLNSKGFINFQVASAYWTSTTVASENTKAYFVGFYGGAVGFLSKSSPYYHILPVRLGQSDNPDNNYPSNIPKTGQKESYARGDDGDIEKGVALPTPRFIDNGDGTVTDNLTGLIWLKNANCFGLQTWESALNLVNNLSNGQCGLSDGSQLGNWRLPNRRELRSLIDYGRNYPALSEINPFNNIEPEGYWSSSTHSATNNDAWTVNLGNGSSYEAGKTIKRYVWAVRDNSVCTPPFTDVPCRYWAYNEIVWAKEVGITTGWPDGTYRPDEPVKRDAMAAFFIRALYRTNDPVCEGGIPCRNTEPYFTDVGPEQLFFAHIQKLRERGITRGWPDGTYRPYYNIRRDAMAAFLVRAILGTDDFEDYSRTPYFQDVPVSHPFFKHIQKLKELGITRGCNPPDYTLFCPDREVKRSEMAVFLWRAFLGGR